MHCGEAGVCADACSACTRCGQVSGEGEFFARMVVDAVSKLDLKTLDMSLLGIKKARIISALLVQ